MLHYTNLYNVNVTIYKLIVSIYKLMLHFNKMYVCCYIWRRQNVIAEIRLIHQMLYENSEFSNFF